MLNAILEDSPTTSSQGASRMAVSLEGVAPVSLPAALPLLSALGVFGFFGWRKKRMVVA